MGSVYRPCQYRPYVRYCHASSTIGVTTVMAIAASIAITYGRLPTAIARSTEQRRARR